MEAEEEAGAGGVQVKAGNAGGQSQLPLEHAGGGGDDGIRRNGGHDAGADLVGRDARLFQSGSGGPHAERGVGLRGAVVAVADAGAGGDPLVTGIHDLGKVLVGDDFLRDTAAGAANLDSVHESSFWGAAAPIFRNF